MTENKAIVKELKDSIEYRSKHKKIIDKFLRAVKEYFLDKYDFHIKTTTGIKWFSIEKDISYYYGGTEIIDTDFKFTTKVLYEFCMEFECELDNVTCDGDRFVFTFEDVDMSNAFIIG